VTAIAPRGGRGSGLDGPQKAAVLCMVLGTDQAAKVMQLLTPDQAELLGREIAGLPSVASEVVDDVLGEYRSVARAVSSVAQGGVEAARAMLEAAFGPARAKVLLQKIEAELSDTGLRRLKRATPDILLGVIRGEHPQTVALIMAHLDEKQAAGVIEAMDPELAADVLYRVAQMEKVSPDMLALVEAGLSSKADLSLTEEMRVSGGPLAVANVLNLAGPTLEKTLLDQIATRDQKLVEAIKALMFVFEDLILLDKRAMQRVLRDIDSKELALGLKVASHELKDHILGNMSERAAEALREEMEFLGPVRVKDVEGAHGRIIAQVRALEEQGEIQINSRGSDDVVA
jgi:flagellar motor switch protein FliG